MRRKSKRWQRERMVAGILWASVVAKMNLTCGGRLLQRLEQGVERRRREHVDFVDDVDLEAAAGRGGTAAFSRGSRTLSTPLLLAPSISMTSTSSPPAMARQVSQCAAGRRRSGRGSQLRALARMRAVVVLPTPRGRRRGRRGRRGRCRSALRSAWTTCSWPTTSSHNLGTPFTIEGLGGAYAPVTVDVRPSVADGYTSAEDRAVIWIIRPEAENGVQAMSYDLLIDDRPQLLDVISNPLGSAAMR